MKGFSAGMYIARLLQRRRKPASLTIPVNTSPMTLLQMQSGIDDSGPAARSCSSSGRWSSSLRLWVQRLHAEGQAKAQTVRAYQFGQIGGARPRRLLRRARLFGSTPPTLANSRPKRQPTTLTGSLTKPPPTSTSRELCFRTNGTPAAATRRSGTPIRAKPGSQSFGDELMDILGLDAILTGGPSIRLEGLRLRTDLNLHGFGRWHHDWF